MFQNYSSFDNNWQTPKGQVPRRGQYAVLGVGGLIRIAPKTMTADLLSNPFVSTVSSQRTLAGFQDKDCFRMHGNR